MLKPVTPLLPIRLNRNPPINAPTTPTTMSPISPRELRTTMLASQQATAPTIIQAKNPIWSIFCILWSLISAVLEQIVGKDRVGYDKWHETTNFRASAD